MPRHEMRRVDSEEEGMDWDNMLLEAMPWAGVRQVEDLKEGREREDTEWQRALMEELAEEGMLWDEMRRAGLVAGVTDLAGVRWAEKELGEKRKMMRPGAGPARVHMGTGMTTVVETRITPGSFSEEGMWTRTTCAISVTAGWRCSDGRLLEVSVSEVEQWANIILR